MPASIRYASLLKRMSDSAFGEVGHGRDPWAVAYGARRNGRDAQEKSALT